MDISLAKKVLGAPSEQIANELIKDGWKLLSVASGKDEDGAPQHKYSLGWFEKEAPPNF